MLKRHDPHEKDAIIEEFAEAALCHIVCCMEKVLSMGPRDPKKVVEFKHLSDYSEEIVEIFEAVDLLEEFLEGDGYRSTHSGEEAVMFGHKKH